MYAMRKFERFQHSTAYRTFTSTDNPHYALSMRLTADIPSHRSCHHVFIQNAVTALPAIVLELDTASRSTSRRSTIVDRHQPRHADHHHFESHSNSLPIENLPTRPITHLVHPTHPHFGPIIPAPLSLRLPIHRTALPHHASQFRLLSITPIDVQLAHPRYRSSNHQTSITPLRVEALVGAYGDERVGYDQAASRPGASRGEEE